MYKTRKTLNGSTLTILEIENSTQAARHKPLNINNLLPKKRRSYLYFSLVSLVILLIIFN